MYTRDSTPKSNAVLVLGCSGFQSPYFISDAMCDYDS